MRKAVSRLLMGGMVFIVAGLILQSSFVYAQQKVEPSNEAKWYFSPGIGWQDWQGDEECDDAFLLDARLGYDYNEWWSFEGFFYTAPYIKEKMRNRWYPKNDPNGSYREVSMVDGTPGEKFGDTFMAAVGSDALFHFTRWERLDPYLTLGLAASWYGDEINGHNFDVAIRGGGGVMWHFNDEWAVRGDFRAFLVGNDTEANSMIDAGVVWTWGARVPAKIVATGGPLDSDRDGLTDVEEEKWKTNPYDPDTDKDGLKDGEEVYTYKTDPLNPDTDADRLKDGDEVHKHTTDPLDADTDDGGVVDGHEVLEDNTDPRAGHGNDDLVLFELYIQFEYDKAIIKTEYYKQLDVIGKVLARHSKATAKVEGHCDQFKTTGHISLAPHNKKLSKDRAKAVVEYLISNCQIASGRLSSNGYGFERPKDPKKVDLVNGNPENRRVEIYIKGVDKTKAQLESEGYVIPEVDPTPPVPEKK
ncbi:MAG: OmpA family protein [Kiritimatiellae bacterium]|nr:OmpA family protein [Kiritimatiellia bacterium]MDD5520224.1 OmpA family protein [Kiritimatiellia bacterium]